MKYPTTSKQIAVVVFVAVSALIVVYASATLTWILGIVLVGVLVFTAWALGVRLARWATGKAGGGGGGGA